MLPHILKHKNEPFAYDDAQYKLLMWHDSRLSTYDHCVRMPRYNMNNRCTGE